MAGNDYSITSSFRGTREQVRDFLLRQPTQVGKSWVVMDFTGAKIYLI